MKHILYILLTIILIGCSPMKEIIEVPVENTRTEYINNTIIDSVFVKDSVDRYINGDTVFIYKEHTKYKFVNKTDTVNCTDTITKVLKITTVKEVKVNYLHWYQKALMYIGYASILFLIGIITYKFKK